MRTTVRAIVRSHNNPNTLYITHKRMMRCFSSTFDKERIKKLVKEMDEEKESFYNYKVLDLELDVSEEDIKKRFVAISKYSITPAKSLHPDTNSEVDSEDYGKLADAYKVLSNAERRAKYDDMENAKLGKVNVGRYSLNFWWVFG